MVVPISITASKSGSDPSSSQNPEKHENGKPLPAVDATSMLMDESHGPEFCLYDDQKLKKKHVPDKGQTFAANPPCVGPQHVPHMLWMQQQLYPVAFQPNFVLCDEKDICDTRDKIAYQQDQLDQKDQVISDLQTDLEKAEDELCEKKEIISKLERKLEKKKGKYLKYEWVCTKDSSLREKEAELATCRANLVRCENEIRQLQVKAYTKESSLRGKEAELTTCRTNLVHCENEIRQLQDKVRASQGSISYEKELLKMELAQQWMMTIQQFQAELAARADQFIRLLFDCQRQEQENVNFDGSWITGGSC